jgi:hypothetical protein
LEVLIVANKLTQSMANFAKSSLLSLGYSARIYDPRDGFHQYSQSFYYLDLSCPVYESGMIWSKEVKTWFLMRKNFKEMTFLAPIPPFEFMPRALLSVPNDLHAPCAIFSKGYWKTKLVKESYIQQQVRVLYMESLRAYAETVGFSYVDEQERRFRRRFSKYRTKVTLVPTDGSVIISRFPKIFYQVQTNPFRRVAFNITQIRDYYGFCVLSTQLYNFMEKLVYKGHYKKQGNFYIFSEDYRFLQGLSLRKRIPMGRLYHTDLRWATSQNRYVLSGDISTGVIEGLQNLGKEVALFHGSYMKTTVETEKIPIVKKLERGDVFINYSPYKTQAYWSGRMQAMDFLSWSYIKVSPLGMIFSTQGYQAGQVSVQHVVVS